MKSSDAKKNSKKIRHHLLKNYEHWRQKNKQILWAHVGATL